MPTGAGYELGARPVRNYLDKTGTTVARNVRISADRIIVVAQLLRSHRQTGRPAEEAYFLKYSSIWSSIDIAL
jgi:hypothetical protein